MDTKVWSLASLIGLGIQWCHKLWCGLQMRLGSCIVMAVVSASGYSSDLTPTLGTSICHRCGPKKEKKKKKQEREDVLDFCGYVKHFHNLKSLKQYTFIVSFHGQESGQDLAVFSLQVSHKCSQVWAGAVFLPEAWVLLMVWCCTADLYNFLILNTWNLTSVDRQLPISSFPSPPFVSLGMAF